jgi:hypothetical protein
MNLLISRDGKTFHLPSCTTQGSRQVWRWATSKTYLQVLEGVHGMGIYSCARCLPPNYMPPPEDR